MEQIATDQLAMDENGKDLENFKLHSEVQPSVTAARKREFKQIIVEVRIATSDDRNRLGIAFQ